MKMYIENAVLLSIDLFVMVGYPTIAAIFDTLYLIA